MVRADAAEAEPRNFRREMEGIFIGGWKYIRRMAAGRTAAGLPGGQPRAAVPT
jgi:hypothetical protein